MNCEIDILITKVEGGGDLFVMPEAYRNEEGGETVRN